MRINLRQYDHIVVNSSAGKDSQAMLDLMVAYADEDGVRNRLVVLHCDLGKSPKGEEIEWPDTKELAAEHARHYGLRFIMVKRKVRGFLEEIIDRGAWPSSTERYCTSYYKRDQGNTVLTMLAKETRKLRGTRKPWILNSYGFRSEESPRRRKMKQFFENDRASNSRKQVDNYLPIQEWTLDQVWARIKQAGTRHHPAYDQGMTRLSCRFCIFAPKSQLMLSARLNPKLFQEYVDVEKQIGHTFRKELSLVEVQRAVQAGEECSPDDGAWNM